MRLPIKIKLRTMKMRKMRKSQLKETTILLITTILLTTISLITGILFHRFQSQSSVDQERTLITTGVDLKDGMQEFHRDVVLCIDFFFVNGFVDKFVTNSANISRCSTSW